VAHSLTIELSDETYDHLRQIVESGDWTFEECAAYWLAAIVRDVAPDPLLRLCGSIRSDVTERLDPYQEPNEDGARIDEEGRAYAGSQRQIQIYVNDRQTDLERAIAGCVPDMAEPSRFHWVSPLQANQYAEYRDGLFLRSLGLGAMTQKLADFWPARGPAWDALATVEFADHQMGVLLCEAKSYPGEMFGGGCKAGRKSWGKIEKALGWVQNELGVAASPALWMGRLYQMANRLAHLYWLRKQGVNAWLIHVLFIGDPRSPTTQATWETAMDVTEGELGIRGIGLPHAGHIFLPAIP